MLRILKRLHTTGTSLLLAGLLALPATGQDLPQGPPLVNQAGYNRGEAKRVTVPGAADGTPFHVRRLISPKPGTLTPSLGEVVYEGRIRGQVGDFTPFEGKDSNEEYVITVEEHGQSYPFRIADYLMETLSSGLAYQFFIDVRGGTDVATFDPKKTPGGGPSRDGGLYTLETPFEVLFYASNPALFDRWTTELGTATSPDLIDLILWHAAFAYKFRDYNGPVGSAPYLLGYEGGPMQTYDYQNALDHLAAALAGYHSFLKPYLSETDYRNYRRAALDLWEKYDRQKPVKYWVKSRKWIDEGWVEYNEMGNALGQSVLRNLMMYVAERQEPDGQPERFLGYAREVASDLIKTWNFDDPRHTWLHRNAEHIAPEALAWFLMVAPEAAPAGTREKLQAWSDYVKQRSNNLWQYRTHSDTEWAHPKSKEVGTVAGLGGAMFAVAHVLGDADLRTRGWSQVNYVFGQNPVGAHLSYKSPERIERGGYWPGVERGWPDEHSHGLGDLWVVRGTLDGSPLNHAFPFRPEAYAGIGTDKAYATEGWAVTNRAWMSTLTFSTAGSFKLTLLRPGTESSASVAASGDSVTVRLHAALNRHPGEVEKGWVDVMVLRGDRAVNRSRLPVKETGRDTSLFQGILHLADTRPGDRVEVSYGYLGFETKASVTVK